MDGIKFEFSDIKSLYTKTILDEDGQPIILVSIFGDIIVIKVIYFSIGISTTVAF